jgi:hypothetical protein
MLLMSTSCVASEIYVITHADTPLNGITKNQLFDLYMGRRNSIENSGQLYLIERDRNSMLREQFFRSIKGVPLPVVNAYWAKLVFTGKVKAPKTIEPESEVIRNVSLHRNSLAYVTDKPDVEMVKVLLVLAKGR